MIINNIHINIFAGLINKDINFEKGLNVVLGPNEVGKSTIFHTLDKVLFTSTSLTPSKFDKQMGRFLPIGGGDTIDAAIRFSHAGDDYELWRSWGSTATSKLKLPGGAIVTDNDKIQEKVVTCLQVSEGTCKSVMMTYQSNLSKTLSELQEDTQTLQSFGDLMRAVEIELDGVSVDALKVAVDNRYKDYTACWDLDIDFPENNRGVNNPYLKGHGTIVKAFYKEGNIRKQIDHAKSFEQEMDRLNSQIREVIQSLSKHDVYLKEYKKARGDAEKRSRLNSDLESLDLKIDKLKKVNKEWPVADQKIKDINALLPDLGKKELAFSQEKMNAQKAEDSRDLLTKYERVKAKKVNFDESEKMLNQTTKLTQADLQQIRELEAEISKLKASLSAGKLFLKFTSKKSLDLTTQAGFAGETIHEVKAGETLELDADGRLKISHSDWTMVAASGDGSYEELIQKHDEAQQSLKELLKKMNVDSPAEAGKVHETYARQLQELEVARDNLASELGEESFASLEKSVDDIDIPENVRKVAAVVEDLMGIQNQTSSLNSDLEDFEEKITGWKDEYEDTDALLLNLADYAREKKDKTKDIDSLAPMPEDTTAEEFIEFYDQTETDYQEKKDERNSLVQDRLKMEAEAPDSSEEEYEKELSEATDAFNQELKKGHTITRIRQVMDELLADMDSNTYEGFNQAVAKYLAMITDDRYSAIEMDASLPSGINRSDGELIIYDQLSQGTQDVLSLALRLAMVDKYLEDLEGFIIMDDPFVDLDPKRQEQAANVITEFAKNKQVILFTCHPSHAELLGGHQIQLK